MGRSDQGAPRSTRALRTGLAVALAVAVGMIFAAGTPARGRAQAPAPAHAAAPPPGTLIVQIVGMHSDHGHVACALFAGPRGFPAERRFAVAGERVKSHGRQAVCRFIHVRPGVYAVSVLHDENDDGHMDTGLFGIPSEGYGASNDAHQAFGPPRYRDAKFRFDGRAERIVIHMRY